MDTDSTMVGAPSAGGDLGSSAPAPGPRAGRPPADVLFTLTATGATLAADTLTLTGVADAALFSTAASQTGVYTTGAALRMLSPCSWHLGCQLPDGLPARPWAWHTCPVCCPGLI